MAEFAVRYSLDADSLLVKDLVTERDFLAERLGIPEHYLIVISWWCGSVVITYWIVRDVLPLAELALCREDVRAELTQHGVEEVYLDSHLSEHPGPVGSTGIVHRWHACAGVCSIPPPLPYSMQVDQSLQTLHRKETQSTHVMHV